MSNCTSIQAALQVLDDNSISYLMRCENYRIVESTLSKGDPLSPPHIKQLLQIFAYDLKQDTKYAVTILKLLSIILQKVELGEYASYPELSSTAIAIMNILSKMAPLHKVQSLQNLCLEVLLSYPDELYVDLGTKHTPDLVNLMDQYLSNTNVESETKVMMMDIIVKVLKALPEADRKALVKEGLSVWFSRLVPLIFSGLPLKEKAVTITETIIPDIIHTEYGDNPQWNVLFKNIVEKYPQEMKKMLIDGDSLWCRAWCCIVRLLGTKLHKSANLINALLSVLENAFKMNMTDRCRAFQCWKLLIENFSLNMNQFFTNRRIKLLLIPLVVNNAKEENSASAKFETWWFLLGLLQPKIEQYMDSIVVPFLQFCFGQLRPPRENEKPTVVPGLTYTRLQPLMIQSIVEMVGHRECSGCISENFTKLPASILNPRTLTSHLDHWMHAIKEATILITTVLNDKTEQNISCLYKSVLKNISAIEDTTKQATAYRQFMHTISQIVLTCQENSSLANVFFEMIAPSIFHKTSELFQLDYEHNSGSDIFFKLLLCPAFDDFFSPCTDILIQKLKHFISAALQCKEGFAKWLLQELPTGERSLTWWISLVQSIVDSNCNLDEGMAKDIFIWPITKLEYFSDVQKAAQNWSEMYVYIKQKLPQDSQLHLDIMSILMLHYKNTLVHNVFTIHVLPQTIKSVLENDPNKINSMEEEFRVLSQLSATISDLSKDYEKNLESTTECLNYSLIALTQKPSTEVTKYTLISANNVWKCVLTSQTLNQDDKIYLLLKLLNPMKDLFSKHLHENSILVLIDEFLSEWEEANIPNVKNIIHDIRKNFKTEGCDYNIHGNSNKSNSTMPNTHKLESDCTEIKTPKSKTPNKIKSAGKIVKKVMDGNEEFVVVKSNWKFNPNKLTEHQKEVMKKKREDIPALYQDLSQSQDEVKIKTWKVPDYKSDSQDVSSSTSISLEKNDTNTSLSNILKDIPNREICPNLMKAITKEDSKPNDKVQTPNNTETLKENSVVNEVNKATPKTLPKITPSKSPRMSLKDKVSKSVQSLLGNVVTSQTPPMNKTLNSQNQQTPKSIHDQSANNVFSAPPKLDSERPSRTKRKPKKLEEDFEILNIVKKRKQLVDNEVKLSEYRKESKDIDYPEKRLEEENIMVMDALNCQKQTEELKSNNAAERECITIQDDSNPLPPIPTNEITQLIDNSVNKTETTMKSAETEKITSANLSENTPSKYIPKPKCKQTPEKKLMSSKKKNRLVAQLTIDTVEGHPLLTPKDDVRSTRKNRQLSESQTKRSNIEKTRISIDGTPKVNKESKKSKPKISVTETSDTIIDITIDAQSSDEFGESVNKNVSLASEDKSLKPTLHLPVSVELPLSEDVIESSQDSLASTISIKSSRRSNHKHYDNTLQKAGNKATDSSSTTECESQLESATSHCDSPIAIKKIEDLFVDTNIDEVDRSVQDERNSTSNDLNTKTVENYVDETIAIMDTQPLETQQNHEVVANIEQNDETMPEMKTQLPETIDLSNDANEETNTVKDLSGEEIAQMDTEPLVPTLDSCKELTCPNEVIVIDDNSCDVSVVPTTIINHNSDIVAEADTEPVQNSLAADIVTSKQSTSKSLKTTEDVRIPYSENISNTDSPPNNTPRSPFEDNQERENEFLNNTLDISPIKVFTPQKRDVSPPPSDENSNDFVLIKLTSPVKGNGEPIEQCDSPEMFTNEKVSPDKQDESPPRTSTTISTGSPSSSLSLKKNKAQMRPFGRGAQMLGLCNPIDLYENSEQTDESDEPKRAPVGTPVRRNLRITYGTCTENERPVEVTNQVENFLSLTKELPTANSSPSGPILKRKLAEIADESTMSPASKRKRVSFHDPPVSTTISVQKYIEETCIRSPQQNKSKDRRIKTYTSKKKLENVYPEAAPVETMEVANEESIEKQIMTMAEVTQMNSLADTPVAVIVARDELTSTDPIFLDLIDCTDPIANIISELTTDSMKDMFLKDLHDIVTIGDLAKLTELEVSRLSLKTPKVETARKVLTSYAKKPKNEPTPKVIEVSHMEIQTEFEEEFLWVTLKERTSKEVIETCLEKKADFIEEFSSVVSTEVKQKIAEDLPVSAIGDLLSDRLRGADHKESPQIFTTLVQNHPQKFLDKVFSEVGVEEFSEKLSLENVQDYLLKKLSFVDLVKFCTTTMQKKLPSD